MNDFWISSGHHLLDRDESGGLRVTDEFLKLYLARPELLPPAEACAAERTLHADLMVDPRLDISSSDIAAIADPDARENWRLLIALRETARGTFRPCSSASLCMSFYAMLSMASRIRACCAPLSCFFAPSASPSTMAR